MSESTDRAQQCLKAFLDGDHYLSSILMDQVKDPSKLKNYKLKCGSTLLHLAAAKGWLDIVKTLLNKYDLHPMCRKNNGSIPLHSASHNGHLEVVQYLITEMKCDPMYKNNRGFVPLHSACDNGHLHVVKYLITECECDPMCRNSNDFTPLYSASCNGHLNIIQYLITECKCDPMCKTKSSSSPLHVASENGHLDVVRYLLFDCQCDPMQKDNTWSTPLYYACVNSHIPVIECILSTGRVDPQFSIFSSNRPLRLGKQNRDEVEKLFAKFSKLNTCISADSYVSVVLLGNPGAGKSTLAQVITETSCGRHWVGGYRQVKGVELHTAGIVSTRMQHAELGNIILYDLAGNPEYYSSHIAVLDILKDCPVIFINCVNLSEEGTLNLNKWITVIQNVSENMSSPCRVVTVASHVDMITPSKLSHYEEYIPKILSTRLEGFNVNNELIGLDCRLLGGDGFCLLMSTLANSCQEIRCVKNMDLYCRMLYTVLEKESEIIHRVDSLCQLITTQKFSDNYYLPQEPDEILKTLSLLHSTGLIIFLNNTNTPGNSWVIVDQSVLLAKVNGVLFAPENFKQNCNVSSNTGIVTKPALKQVFPDYDPDMIFHFLCYMKLSMEITSDMLKDSNLERKPHNCSNDVKENCLFIPALISEAQRPPISETIQFGWCLQCSNSHQFFFPWFLHVLLLHLAYQYALPKAANNPLHRKCHIWRNGIVWSDDEGVKTLVENVDNSQCILLLMSCDPDLKAKHNMIKLRKEVIKDILSHQKDICPILELQEFIIGLPEPQLHDPIDKFKPSSLTLYDIEHVARCVVNLKQYVTPYNNEGKLAIKISALLPFERINPETLSVFAGRNPMELVPEFVHRTAEHRISKKDDPEVVLDISDLMEVMESVKEVVDWKDLGLNLGLFYITLEEIETDQNRVNKCRREMLAAWLKGEDNSRERTWTTLVDAVQKMNNHALAEKIKQQHL